MLERWHLRRLEPRHDHRFANLADRHRLTRAWQEQLKPLEQDYALSRGFPRELARELWMLETLETQPSPDDLLDLLDDTELDDALTRLEQAVDLAQAWTLRTLLERCPDEDRPSLFAAITQASWKAGREAARRRWPEAAALDPRAPFRWDLAAVTRAVRLGPFLSCEDHSTLIRRSSTREVELELLVCPHRRPPADGATVAHELCLLRESWQRGAVYAIDPRFRLDRLATAEPGGGAGGRCRWVLRA